MTEPIKIPDDVLRALLRLERKRIWRESLDARIEAADQAADREKEGNAK